LNEEGSIDPEVTALPILHPRQHDPYIPRIHVVQCVPIAGRGKGVAASLRGEAERTHRLLRKQDVIELAAGREKRQHLRTGGLGLPRGKG